MQATLTVTERLTRPATVPESLRSLRDQFALHLVAPTRDNTATWRNGYGSVLTVHFEVHGYGVKNGFVCDIAYVRYRRLIITSISRCVLVRRIAII